MIALAVLSGIDIGFHAQVLLGADPKIWFRAGVSVLVALIGLVGGRIVPSFTRNWLAKAGSVRLPAPHGRFDTAAMGALVLALASWTVLSEATVTAVLAAAASVLQLWRLIPWCDHATMEEPLLVVLHVAYTFVPLGMLGIALSAPGWFSAPAALHLLTVEAIGAMTLAVMTRVTLGHTGRRLVASAWTSLAYLSLLVSAVVRPFAELLPEHYHTILGLSGSAWMPAFIIFSVEYGRMLVTPKWTTAPAR